MSDLLFKCVRNITSLTTCHRMMQNEAELFSLKPTCQSVSFASDLFITHYCKRIIYKYFQARNIIQKVCAYVQTLKSISSWRTSKYIVP